MSKQNRTAFTVEYEKSREIIDSAVSSTNIYSYYFYLN